MATETLKCEAHGEATRLTCVDCGRPICPRCLVRTEVGLKCASCAQPAVPTPAVGARSRLPLALALAGLGVLAVVVALLVLRPTGRSTVATRQLPPVGSWSDAPNLEAIRGTTAAVILEDGSVLVAGGGVGAIPLNTAELFDPAAGKWTRTAPLTQARRGHQAVLLRDGRVLVAGGIAEGELLASTEIYDPKAGRWSPVAPMSTGRLGHSLTLLADGRVLAAGGTAVGAAEGGGGTQSVRPDASAEIFDPASGRWSRSGGMGSARFEHTATALTDGRVLIVGGLGPVEDGRVAPLASSEVYDSAANAFVRATDLAEARTNHAAVLLQDGSVLVVGGAGGSGGDVSLASAEVFDPRQGSWTGAAPLSQSRTGATATRLADGRVLVAGGEAVQRGSRRSLDGSEVFDPAAREWRSGGSMRCPRSEQAAVLLRDGSVLVVAGDAAFPGKAPVAQSCATRYRP